MRNYLSFYVGRIHVYFNGALGGFVNIVAGDASSASDRVAFWEDQYVTGQPFGPGTYTFPTVDGPVQAFWCLDKESLVKFLSGIEAAVFDIIFPNSQGLEIPPELPAPDQQFMRVVLETPRYTGWKDQLGVKRAAPPSDKKGPKSDLSGAQGLFDAATGLLAYSQALRDSGRIRDANIVKFAYDNIFNGTWTITQAFDYLRKNGLA
jgi:hypothetical protein